MKVGDECVYLGFSGTGWRDRIGTPCVIRRIERHTERINIRFLIDGFTGDTTASRLRLREELYEPL